MRYSIFPPASKHMAFLAAFFLLLILFQITGAALECEIYAQNLSESGSEGPEDETITGSEDTARPDDWDDRNLEIFINVPAFKLRLIAGSVIEAEYKVRVGSTKNKTVTGEGEVTRKFAPSYFRYSDGPQKGEIIRYSNIRDRYKGKIVKRIKIPYEKVKGLELEINGVITGQIIHATTNPETLGHACSTGCIGMSIDDMLELYQRAGAGTKVTIVYNPAELIDGIFYFYDDIYGYEPDMREIVENELSKNGISYTPEFVEMIVKKGRKNKKVKLADVYVEIRDRLAAEEVR